jgi:hypothetical protein
MGFIDILRKVGILRTEKTSWCGDLKERPVTMSLDEVCQERKTFFAQENVRLWRQKKE